MDLVKMVIGLLTGSAGAQVGGAVSRVAQVVALLAAIAPIALWLRSEKDAVFVTITYGELSFWGSLMAAMVIISLRNAHRAPPPA